MRNIKTIKNNLIIVDNNNYYNLNKFEWNISCGYPYRYKKGHIWFIHWDVIGKPKKGFVTDHINGNKLDNRLENLRICNTSQNHCNKGLQKNNKSGFKGVCWHKKRKKWRVKVQKDKKIVFSNEFYNKIDAANAYNIAVIKYHGKFARINNVNTKI